MRLFIVTALAAVACAGIVPATGAQSAVRPALDRGPHAVGFRTVDQYDHSRTLGDGFDDEGRAIGGERSRPIPTSIWYPSTVRADAAPMRYRDYLALSVKPGAFPARDDAGRRAAAAELARRFGATDTSRIRRELAAAMLAVRDAPPASGSFPVIVYGPSFNAPSFENASLMEYLASHGYIVISSPSMGASGGQSADIPGLESQARDMEFLIAYARTVPGADLARLAVMGFSWGGMSDVLVALRNSSVRALVSLDGSIEYFYHRLFETAPFASGAHLSVPALFLQQKRPDAAFYAGLGPDTTFDFFRDLRYSEAYLVDLKTIGHQNFGEWFNRLSQTPNRVFVTDTLVQRAGYERIALYSRHFLDAYLKQSATGKAYLARSPSENGFPASEVTVQRKIAAPPRPTTIGAFTNALLVRRLRPADAPALFAEQRTVDPAYALEEGAVNAWGYRLMAAKRLEDAIGVLRMNAAAYPKSANAHDSLGEAYMSHGDRTSAIESYRRSFELDSTNTRAAEMLKKLGAPAKP